MPERFGLLTMNGLAVFRFAVTTLVHLIPETLAAAGITIDDIDLIMLHQSNLRIVNSVRLQLDLTEEKCPTVIETTGNTSGGSVGMLLDAQLKAGRIRPGTNILFAAVGGGLSWGAASGGSSARANATFRVVNKSRARSKRNSRLLRARLLASRLCLSVVTLC